MKNETLNKFINSVFEDMKDSFNSVTSEIESPIESILCGVLLTESVLRFSTVIFQGHDDGISFGGDGPDLLRIFPQHQIGKYRVDFYLEYLDTSFKISKKLIIECDGHDFHEKTKEQAQRDKKRDRILQETGAIFRFTGSEIYKNPHACADQIINFLTNQGN